MNRRLFLSMLAAVLPTSIMARFAKASPVPEKDWEEYDFEFEGAHCTYFVLPRHVPALFVDSRDNNLFLPLFDLRHVGDSLEANIRSAIKSFLNVEKEKTIDDCFLSVVSYKGFPEQVGIIINGLKTHLKTDFITSEVQYRKNLWRSSIIRAIKQRKASATGKSVMTFGKLSNKEQKEVEKELDRRIKEFVRHLNSKQYLVDDAQKFFERVKNS